MMNITINSDTLLVLKLQANITVYEYPGVLFINMD